MRSIFVLFLACASALPGPNVNAFRVRGGAQPIINMENKSSLLDQIDSTMALYVSSLALAGYALEASYPDYFSKKYTVSKKYEGNGQFWYVANHWLFEMLLNLIFV